MDYFKHFLQSIFKDPVTQRDKLILTATYLFQILVGVISGRSTKNVSDRFRLKVTPPSFWFSIWGLIYTFLFIVVGVELLKEPHWSAKTYHWLAITGMLNGLWVAVFAFNHKLSNLICELILVGLVYSIFQSWLAMYDPRGSSLYYFFERNVIAFYLGWCLAASILNLGIVLVHSLSIPQDLFTKIFWLLTVALAVGVPSYIYHLEGVHGLKSCFAAWLSISWAWSGAFFSMQRQK